MAMYAAINRSPEMHTVEALDDDAVEVLVDGSSVPRDDVLPTITPSDRVGVVMGAGAEGLGAATFLLACVSAFYEEVEADGDDSVTYPDYYTIQATTDPADFRMFDLYPSHKNVAVAGDAERILEVVVDRAIDILLVPERQTRVGSIHEITRRSAERTIDACYVYASDGRPEHVEFDIQAPRDPVVDWFRTTVESMSDPPRADDLPSFGAADDLIVQGYRRTDLASAIASLPRGAED